jgi:WD40 repeat protein
MIREFYPTISVACLQLHHDVIPFLPLHSCLSQVYGQKIQPGIDIREGQHQTWSACVGVLEGHTQRCTSVAFSSDGRRLVSGSDDSTIRLWNVQTGALLQVMTGHKTTVYSVAYSPDGKLIASCSADKTVITWDAATGLQVGKYAGHSCSVDCVAFSVDGLRIASTGEKQVHVWSMDATDRSVKVIDVPGWVISFAFMSRNRLLVASTSKAMLTVSELEHLPRRVLLFSGG